MSHFNILEQTEESWMIRIGQIALLLLGLALPFSVWLTNILLPIILLTAVLSSKKGQITEIVRENPTLICILLFYIFCLIRTFGSTGPIADRLLDLHKYGKLLYIPFVAVFFFEKSLREKAISAFLIAAFFTTLVSCSKFLGLHHFGAELDATSLFRNHIQTSFLIAFSAYLFAHRAYISSKFRWLWIACLIITTINLFFMNDSRTGPLVYSFLFLLFSWQHFKWRGLFLGSIILALFSYSVFLSSHAFHSAVSQTVKSASLYKSEENSSSSTHLRLTFLRHSATLIGEHPIFGSGTGSFQTQYSRYGDVPNIGHYLRTPHNEFAMITVQFGLIGLILFLSIFFFQWRSSQFLPKEERWLAQGIVVGFGAGCLCDALLYASTTGFLYVYFAALTFGMWAKQRAIKI